MPEDSTSKLPPPPVKPEPEECCGAGCSPCVLELYEQALEEWGETVRRLKEASAAAADQAPHEKPRPGT